MSRNSSGTYSLPSGNPVSTGTTIASTWANNTISDIGTELTNSLDRGGRGAMTAPLQHTDGSAALPSITFANDTNTGVYRAGADDVRIAANGADVFKATTTGTTTTGSHTVSNGVTVSAGGLTVSAGGVTITGTTAIAGAVSVTGNDVTIDSGKNYKYAATVTHIIHLAGTEFSNILNLSSLVDGSCGNLSSGAASAFAQFRLPPGAIITAIDISAHNADSGSRTWNVLAAKKTKSATDYNSPTYFTTGTGSGVNISVGATTTNWFSVALVGGVASIDDGAADGFNYILVSLPATTSAGQSQMYGARITYTMTAVKPLV